MKKDFFIGIDSDGTAFNSMEIKHKKCFIPAMFEIWSDLDAEAAAAAEKINLYSSTRGINRFSGLLLLFKFMQSKGIDVPDYSSFEMFSYHILSPLSDCFFIYQLYKILVG